MYDNKSFHCLEVNGDRRVSPHKFSRPPCEKFLFYEIENDGVGMSPPRAQCSHQVDCLLFQI